MKHIIIVFERPDIPSASIIQKRLENSEVWVFDPHLLDDLAHAQVQNCVYLNCGLSFDVPEFSTQTQHEAIAVEREIEVFLQGTAASVPFRYWQHLSWFFLQGTIQGYPRLWDALLASGMEGKQFHVPLCDKPALFYAPSFLPAVLLMERMASRGIPFTAYTHSTSVESPRYLPANLPAFALDTYDVFVHLPTCIYDPGYYADELVAANKHPLNFESQNWNVPLPAFDQATLVHDGEVLSLLDTATQAQITKSAAEIERWLTGYFQRHVCTTIYAERQARHIAEQYRTQLIFFHYLDTRFPYGGPKTLVLSNHDAGLHGPFLAFAQKHEIAVVMLPHAKVFNFPVACVYTNIVTPTHPMQGGNVSTLEGKRLHAPTLGFPEVLTHGYRVPARLKVIGLILNKFSVDGMSLVDTDNYLKGLQTLKDWCFKQDIELRIRLKPGGACMLWLASSLNLPPAYFQVQVQMSMASFVNATDLCLMYDAPTSGAAELLRCAVPLLSVTPRALAIQEALIVSKDLVPQLTVAQTIDKLFAFQQDPVNLTEFRSDQFRRYVDRAARGIPLRTLL